MLLFSRSLEYWQLACSLMCRLWRNYVCLIMMFIWSWDIPLLSWTLITLLSFLMMPEMPELMLEFCACDPTYNKIPLSELIGIYFTYFMNKWIFKFANKIIRILWENLFMKMFNPLKFFIESNLQKMVDPGNLVQRKYLACKKTFLPNLALFPKSSHKSALF